MEKVSIIFEDNSLLIVDKPSGWIVNEAKTARGLVLQTWLKEKYRYETIKNNDYRSGIVHRLDKETSGVLIIAKTKKAFTELQGQFKQRDVEKVYKALVHGEVIESRGEINAPVGRLPWNRERFGVLPGGRSALTYYKVLKNYRDTGGKKYSLLNLRPKTGRTHQIRIHLKHIGHPVVSDEFYAGRKTARADRKWCPRLFLHASEISFHHPKLRKIVNYKSRLPRDLEKSLKQLTEE